MSIEDQLTRYDRKTAEYLILTQIEANICPDMEHESIQDITSGLLQRGLIGKMEDNTFAITSKAKAEMATWFD